MVFTWQAEELEEGEISQEDKDAKKKKELMDAQIEQKVCSLMHGGLSFSNDFFASRNDCAHFKYAC